MPKITIEFTLPEEAREYKSALAQWGPYLEGADLAIVLREHLRILNGIVKYETGLVGCADPRHETRCLRKSQLKLIENLRSHFLEAIAEHNISNIA